MVLSERMEFIPDQLYSSPLHLTIIPWERSPFSSLLRQTHKDLRQNYPDWTSAAIAMPRALPLWAFLSQFSMRLPVVLPMKKSLKLF